MDKTKRDEGELDGDADLSAALSKISLIESILGADQDIPSEVTFQLPLTDVLALFPSRYVKATSSEAPSQEKISITMDDLFTQLSKGKATMSVSKLAFFVPSHLLQQEAFSDTTTMISLPLPIIIQAVGIDRLKNHLAKKVRRYKIDDIEDPFSKIFNRPAGEAPQAAPASAASPAAPTETPPTPAPTAPAEAPRAEEAVSPPSPPPPLPVEPSAVAKPEPPPEPLEKAVAAEAPTPAAPEKVAAEEVKPAPKAARPKPRRAAQALTPEQMVPEANFHELPGNANINSASVEELMSLEGITETIAKNIVEFRTQNGPFKSVFDLVKVPRLSHSLFKRITGMPFSPTGYHRRYKLAHLLKLPVDQVTDFALLAKALAEQPGFCGCVIADKDGLLLAQNKAEEFGENWGAVAAAIMNHVRERIQLLPLGGVDSVSLGIKGNAVTIVASENVLLTVIHEGMKLTTVHLGLIQKVRLEIAWLLTRRAYVGR
jgi:competence ComEA-like helix-hairpin-helix protein